MCEVIFFVVLVVFRHYEQSKTLKLFFSQNCAAQFETTLKFLGDLEPLSTTVWLKSYCFLGKLSVTTSSCDENQCLYHMLQVGSGVLDEVKELLLLRSTGNKFP